MRIDIALKLRPFSHQSGILCLIPFSTWLVQIFVTKLKFTNLSNNEKQSLDLPIKGPVIGFTVLQDLEKGEIEVCGKGSEGYFRYTLTAEKLHFKNGPQISLPFIEKIPLSPSHKKVSFGVHKKQDWELIQRRKECAEFFPFWVRMAQLVPEHPLPHNPLGTMSLLNKGQLSSFFEAGFSGILVPRFQDEHYLGLVEDVTTDLCPLGLLHEGARQIEALFFQETEGMLHFLPALPKELHAGRWVGIQTSIGHTIAFEWSKKTLKKVIIDPAKEDILNFTWPASVKTFRLRTQRNQKGAQMSCKESLQVKKGQTVLLDRFCK